MLAPRRPLVPVVVGLVLAVLLVSPVSAARDAPASGSLVARLFAPTHSPQAGTRWPIRITARNPHGRDVRGTVRYAYLYQGKVVMRQAPKVKNSFLGDFRDAHLAWSKRTIGLELTFRAIVDTKLGQANLNYQVKVHR
ncbi:MAG TPA: hypothetical protein VHR88_09520 [Solirubrobacteraceae bacterium]|jgi:hypothetical protein|nr:hypothetical protein [Solirubrobacteraceae bacterium]